MTVLHLVEAAGGREQLWGKERVIRLLMQRQREIGSCEPQLVTFSPSLLGELARADGFAVHELASTPARFPLAGCRALVAILRRAERTVLHTHGYKANVLGRLARLFVPSLPTLVSTSHGFVATTTSLRAYNALDRFTAPLSDVVTVPSREMLRAFPPFTRARWVPNAVEDRALPDALHRDAARTAFGWTSETFVAGSLGRLSPEKGVAEFLEAASLARASGLVFALAGDGPLRGSVTELARRGIVQSLGYLAPSDAFLEALDVFVQPSRSEGLSLALLEAMRAGAAIVATDVGSTSDAVRDGIEGLLVTPGDAAAIVAAVMRFKEDAALRARLSAAARARFESNFRIDVQQRAFADLYERRFTSATSAEAL